ncbi:unnamed protein product [Bubo scandiacus]
MGASGCRGCVFLGSCGLRGCGVGPELGRREEQPPGWAAIGRALPVAGTGFSSALASAPIKPLSGGFWLCLYTL